MHELENYRGGTILHLLPRRWSLELVVFPSLVGDAFRRALPLEGRSHRNLVLPFLMR